MSETAPRPPARASKLKLVAKGILALAISAFAIWWAFKDADLEHMARQLERSSPVAVIVFTVGQVLIHGFRVLRWSLYMRPLAPQVSGRALFAAANIGIPATFFVPLRLGEFVRPMLIARSGAPFAGAMASVVVERIADGLCAVGMFFVFFAFVPDSAPIPDELTRLSMGAAIVFGGGLVFLFAAAVARGPVLGLMQRILGRVSPNFADRVVGLTATFLDGLAVLGSPGRALTYIGLTIAFWGGSGVLIWLLASSYLPELPLLAGLFTVPVVVFAVMIPAGPAFAGTFQWGYLLGLGAFGVAKDDTLVISVVAHASQMLTMALFVGAGFLAAEPGQKVETPLADGP